jgi:hypothetical protein
VTSRAARMLEVLRDGKPHTRRDLFDHVGFFLCNNGASELRAAGYDVQQSRERVDGVNVYSYQWVGSLPEEEVRSAGTLASRDPFPATPLVGDAPASSESEPSSLPTPALSASPPGHGLNDPDSGRAGAESEPEQLTLRNVRHESPGAGTLEPLHRGEEWWAA